LTLEVKTMFQLLITGLLLLPGLFLGTAVPPLSPTAVMPPPAPMLISPASGALMDNGCKPKPDGITWDFDWSDVPGATAYHVRVWRNPALPVVNNMAVPSSSYHYVSAPTTYIINTNLSGWRWMVRAKVLGAWGAWSAPRGFMVEKLNTDCP
jgi:hypothetical protein